MILLLDVGGTRLKWATWEGAFRFGDAVVHKDKPLDVFAQLDWRGVTEVWISLVPRVHDPAGWIAAVQQRFGLVPQFAQSRAEWQGLRSSYAQPEKLGVDRWLALVALWNERKQPFCIVSGGTALTFDRVNAQGQHLGGVIAPGFGFMHRALLQATRTPVMDAPHRYDDQLGRDSIAAIRQGAFFAAMGVVGHALRAPGADPKERRIITGGDALALQPTLGEGWEHRPYLVLEGLLALARAKDQA
jgi:type III pantothenate kinase